MGKILGPQGLKGWLKVHSYTRPTENIFNYANWQLSTPSTAVTVEKFAGAGHKLSVKLQGVDDRDAAQLLKNSVISVNAQQLGKLEDKQYYWHQLIGLQVINSDNTKLGVVKELLETGANDVLVIANDEGTAMHAVPWIDEVIKQTDLDAGIIAVDWQLDD